MRTSSGPSSGLGSPSLSTTASSVSFEDSPSKPKIRKGPKRVGNSASATLFIFKVLGAMLPTIIEADAHRTTVGRAPAEGCGVRFDRKHPDALRPHAEDFAARRAFGRRSFAACSHFHAAVRRQR